MHAQSTAMAIEHFQMLIVAVGSSESVWCERKRELEQIITNNDPYFGICIFIGCNLVLEGGSKGDFGCKTKYKVNLLFIN